jgi:V-type H+-transporting ATPase proteolipid subunit
LEAEIIMRLSELASGVAVGTFGVKAINATYKDPSFVVPMTLVLIFSEAIALYGLIIAIISIQ